MLLLHKMFGFEPKIFSIYGLYYEDEYNHKIFLSLRNFWEYTTYYQAGTFYLEGANSVGSNGNTTYTSIEFETNKNTISWYIEDASYYRPSAAQLNYQGENRNRPWNYCYFAIG